MARLPVLSAREVIAALQRAGFHIDRQAGSHVVMVNDEKQRAAVVPVHGGRDLPRGLLHKILRQAGLTAEELRDLLK